MACEVYNLRDSDNFLIKSIENKDTKFNELKLAIDNYKKQKENDEFKKEKKLTKDYILSGLKLLSEDYKVWDEGTLAKFNENKNTNSISKKIISNTEIETIQTSVGLDISKYQQAKNILAKYFTDEGKIIKHKISPSRSTILSDLKSANESINEFNNEMIKHNTNLITSLKEKLDNSKVLEQTTLLDYSVQKANYDNLYLLNDEITKYSSNNNNWELEKASEIIHKSLDLISKEKNQTSTLITFIDNSIKSKFKNLNVNLDFLMEKLKLHSEWNEVEEFAKQSSENLTNLKTEQYISKRNEVIDSFIKIKTHINKLREESIKLWDYGKHRLNAFKTSYESVKSELDTFNTFGFSYSTINDQLNENKTLLTKNADKTFETTSDLLEFLNSLTLTKELEDVDSKNFNIVKNTVTTNINNKLSLGIKIAHTKLDGYKQLIELSDANVLKDGIDTKNKLLQAINSIDWENGNIDDVKNLFDKSFKLITEINNKIIELETLKNKYNNFLDAVENNLRELKNIAEPYLKNQQMNINAKNKIVQKASKDYLNVDSTTDFTNKLNSKNIKEDYMTSWTKIFNEYNLNGFILFCPPCFYLLFCPFLGFNYYFKKENLNYGKSCN
ncbi:hypothetical protein NPA07_02545 [Mycoplasmopsis caviae]|uniref:Uncharacterized protein n=1 Tax=Mycoplasmopsis caviae TaxID=55603 RepID=A0ABY5J006_9BACT|nr:hypothetical protein [Mycoplasmopsis caviae]UUD35731.1 hypothetical protein NPA07_02545 [Mycoplasmopsis caviae]